MARPASPNVFAVSRSIWDDGDFAPEPFTEREAWIWLVSAAAWKDIKARGNAGTINLKRGEFSFAVRFLADKWQWSKSRVDRFIRRIENRDMIRDTSRDGSQVYIINNYNRFQVVGVPKRDGERDVVGDSSGTAAGQQRDKEETGKQVNIKTEEGAAKAASPPKPLLPTWLSEEAWSGYADMRRRIRKPMTARAQTLVIAKLDRWRQLGHDPTSILDYSTQNSYTDVYEPKDARNGRINKTTATDQHLAGIASLIRDSREGNA